VERRDEDHAAVPLCVGVECLGYSEDHDLVKWQGGGNRNDLSVVELVPRPSSGIRSRSAKVVRTRMALSGDILPSSFPERCLANSLDVSKSAAAIAEESAREQMRVECIKRIVIRITTGIWDQGFGIRSGGTSATGQCSDDCE
jgi:hypothetical protein